MTEWWQWRTLTCWTWPKSLIKIATTTNMNGWIWPKIMFVVVIFSVMFKFCGHIHLVMLNRSNDCSSFFLVDRLIFQIIFNLKYNFQIYSYLFQPVNSEVKYYNTYLVLIIQNKISIGSNNSIVKILNIYIMLSCTHL